MSAISEAFRRAGRTGLETPVPEGFIKNLKKHQRARRFRFLLGGIGAFSVLMAAVWVFWPDGHTTSLAGQVQPPGPLPVGTAQTVPADPGPGASEPSSDAGPAAVMPQTMDSESVSSHDVGPNALPSVRPNVVSVASSTSSKSQRIMAQVVWPSAPEVGRESEPDHEPPPPPENREARDDQPASPPPEIPERDMIDNEPAGDFEPDNNGTIIGAANPRSKALSYFQAGVLAEKMKQPELAAENYQKAIQADPKMSKAYLNLGNIRFFGLDDIDAAQEMYRKVLEIDPEDKYAYNNLGATFVRQERWNRAEQNFKAALRRDPEYVDALYNLACLAARRDQPQQAMAYLIQAERLQPDIAAWARTDPDLKALAGQPDFEQFIGAAPNQSGVGK